MPSVKNPVYDARSRLAVASRRGGDPKARAEARRDLAAAKIAQYVTKIVAEAPPLSDEQAAKIAGLLRAGGGGK